MNSFLNLELPGAHGRPVVADLYLPAELGSFPLVIFCHGFKGFKSWGFYDYLPEAFCNEGLAFLRFNFSHNGTNAQIPDAFVEPEAFGSNTIGKELDDLQTILNSLKELPQSGNFNMNAIYLAGHSRGGGIALLSAARDKRIKKLALWNSVSDWNIFMSQFDRERWKEDGVAYIRNSRTGEDLPVGYKLYTDYDANREIYHLGNAAESLEIPLLLVHGTEDKNVHIDASEYFYNKVFHAIFIKVEGGDHTFGIRHPWTEEQEGVPAFAEALSNTIDFFLD